MTMTIGFTNRNTPRDHSLRCKNRLRVLTRTSDPEFGDLVGACACEPFWGPLCTPWHHFSIEVLRRTCTSEVDEGRTDIGNRVCGVLHSLINAWASDQERNPDVFFVAGTLGGLSAVF